MKDVKNSKTLAKSRFNHVARLPEGGYGLYNFHTGSYIKLNELSYDYYDHFELYGAANQKVLKLREAGFLVDYDELRYLKTMTLLDNGRAKIVRLTICPTLACNFACPYCFEAGNNRGGKMSEDVQEDIVRFAERLIKRNAPENLYIVWYGGEPLLCPDIIESLSRRFMELCKETSVTYSAHIITNGYYLDENASRIFETCGFRSAQITLDGPNAATHDKTRFLKDGGCSFEKIMSNISAFRGKTRLIIRCNVQKDNMTSYDELEQKLKEIGRQNKTSIRVYGGHMMGVHEPMDMELSMEEYTDFRKRRMEKVYRIGYRGTRCMFSRTGDYVIDERGNLSKCLESVGVQDDIIGNVKDFDPGVARSQDADQLLDIIESSWPKNDEECLNCKLLPFCLGGCPRKRLRGRKRCTGYKYALDDYVIAVGKERKGTDGK